MNFYNLLYIVSSVVRGTWRGIGLCTCYLNAALSFRRFPSKTLKIQPPGQSGGLHPPETLGWPADRRPAYKWHYKGLESSITWTSSSTLEPDTTYKGDMAPRWLSSACVKFDDAVFPRKFTGFDKVIYTCCPNSQGRGKTVKVLMRGSMDR